jgi:large subunit ribosomal protein L15
MKLHDLKPAPGSHKPKRRKGIGMAAGQGRTSGHGQKGQASRSGGVKRAYFEGGQLPMVRKLPFARGVNFSNPFEIEFAPVNVGLLAQKFDANAEVTPKTLVEKGITHTSDKYIAILATGELDRPLNVTAHKFSAAAKEKIEKAGGTITKLDVTRGGHRVR